jgi:DNA-binding response OmpR family regulator
VPLIGSAGAVPRLLLIEDDEIARQQFSAILSAEGYTVITAPDLRIALDLLRVEQVDGILLDWHLPNLGGADALTAIRALPNQRVVPVVVITGDYSLDERVTRQLEALRAELRFKPIWADELLQLAQRLVDGSRAEESGAA